VLCFIERGGRAAALRCPRAAFGNDRVA